MPRVVDTTGAGDLFAAGFLFGLASGAGHAGGALNSPRRLRGDLSRCGARPEVSLKKLAQDHGLWSWPARLRCRTAQGYRRGASDWAGLRN